MPDADGEPGEQDRDARLQPGSARALVEECPQPALQEDAVEGAGEDQVNGGNPVSVVDPVDPGAHRAPAWPEPFAHPDVHPALARPGRAQLRGHEAVRHEEHHHGDHPPGEPGDTHARGRGQGVDGEDGADREEKEVGAAENAIEDWLRFAHSLSSPRPPRSRSGGARTPPRAEPDARDHILAVVPRAATTTLLRLASPGAAEERRLRRGLAAGSGRGRAMAPRQAARAAPRPVAPGRPHRGDRGLPRPRRSRGPFLPRTHAPHRAALGTARHRLRLLRLRHAPLPQLRGGRGGRARRRVDPRRSSPRATRLEAGACRGPGRLCRALDLDTSFSGRHLFEPETVLTLRDGPPPRRIGVSPRIGIRLAADRPLRFFDADSPAVSGAWRPRAPPG